MAEPIDTPMSLEVKNGFNIDKIDQAYTHEKFMEGEKSLNIHDIVNKLKNDPTCDIDATVFVIKEGIARPVKMNKTQFLEAFKKNESLSTFKESVNNFDTNVGSYNASSDIGTPLLGGPFNKQLYLVDYLRMHTESFKLYHEDPIANMAVQIIHDFVLGRGFRVDVVGKDKKDMLALALWRSFEDVNDLQKLVSFFVKEMAIYGEDFFYFLPDGYTKDHYRLAPDQMPSKGVIPRVMLVDPSTVYEVITFPEDISRVLAYQQVYPTQYQMYTNVDGKEKATIGTKFIYRQIPADEMIHEKINCVSNEKRGRSDFYPVVGYLKRLKDSINYSLLTQLKQSAWSIDTEIDGDQNDIDAYNAAIQSFGNVPSAGSEFIHSTKIKRTYLANDGGSKSAGGQTWDYCFSMVCAGLGIPQQYFGTHLSGGSTRASAMVATEPVAKKFEYRQLIVERVIKKMAHRLFDKFGIHDVDVEVTFPEVVTHNRNEKIKDIVTAKVAGFLSQDRAANMVSKELQISDFDWTLEQKKIEVEKSKGENGTPTPEEEINPLTAVPKIAQNKPSATTSGINNSDKASAEKNRGF